jgi:hypothetical protein
VPDDLHLSSRIADSHGHQLDADQRDPHVRVDYQALVQDRVDDVSKTRR